jgi:hypothetical protein
MLLAPHYPGLTNGAARAASRFLEKRIFFDFPRATVKISCAPQQDQYRRQSSSSETIVHKYDIVL